jgi:uncharacterized protein YndB with AHSA1/START domain
MKPIALLVIIAIAAVLPAAAQDPLVTEVVVKAPAEAAWKSWTTKAGLEAWLVGRTEIELRIGGVWLTNYNKESNLKDDSTIQQTILAFDPGRMFAFRTSKTPANFPFPSVTQTWTVLYFRSDSGLGCGKSVLRKERKEGNQLRNFLFRWTRRDTAGEIIVADLQQGEGFGKIAGRRAEIRALIAGEP